MSASLMSPPRLFGVRSAQPRGYLLACLLAILAMPAWGQVTSIDIRAGAQSSTPSGGVAFNGLLYFSANDGTNGVELWSSDGTTTTMVKDINPLGNSNPAELIVINGELFFTATDGVNGVELWKSDGTSAGTQMVGDINPTGDSNPTSLIEFNGEVFFQADDGGTPGTVIAGAAFGIELWKSDGTSVSLVKDVFPGTVGFLQVNQGAPQDLTESAGSLFFSANSFTGRELWKSDGTSAGTVLLKEINTVIGPPPLSQPGSGNPSGFVDLGGILYFAADDGVNGPELWSTDGSTGGTQAVSGGGANPSNLTELNGALIYAANNGTVGTEPMVVPFAGGTPALLLDIRSGANSSQPAQFTKSGSSVFFSANDGIAGSELWVTDGTTAGTVLKRDINAGPAGSIIAEMADGGSGIVVFRANDGSTGLEPWSSERISPIADIRSGIAGSNPAMFVQVGSKVFFRANDGSTGNELHCVPTSALLPAPPVITVDPMSQTLCPGAQLVLTVTATGAGITSYDWRKNGISVLLTMSPTFTIPMTVPGDSGNYDVVVTNAAGSTVSGVAVVSISDTTPPVLSACPTDITQPTDIGACDAVVTWTPPSATDNCGAVTVTSTHAPGATFPLGTTVVTYTATDGSGLTDNCSFNVTVTGGAPVITTDPMSQSICVGDPVTFSGAASGNGPISFQWRLNGSDIPAATSSTYTIAAVAAADAGDYTLVATNACGSTTSSAATLTSVDVPTISTNPMSQDICLGSAVTFAGAATGDGTITYQWQLNGSDISGATSASYMIAAVSAADAGAYTLVATNLCGSVASAPATLTTLDVPAVTTDPSSQEICIGASVTFTGAAMGDGPISYQWQLNGSDIGGATSASYMIAAVSAADVGAYTLVATNACGSATSAAAALTTIDVPTITTDPMSQEICIGASVAFTGAAMGDGPISYQWQLNGSDIGGATSASYMIAAVSAADVGAYTLVATNACGSVTSAAAALTTIDVPTITTDPTSQEICIGASVSFTGAAMGDGSISYQWQLNGSDIGGATSASYMIAAVSAADVGAYTLVATNACGSVTSAAAALTTIDVPTITTDPMSQEICIGASVSFTGAAMGDGSISYQWQLNGSDIGGATSASYMIAAVSAADVGAYTLVATNACGSVTSAAAALTTIDVPTITTDPMSQEICIGASVSFTGAAMGDGTISYQWQLNGSDIGGATSASYMIAAVSAADVGAYTLVATNACGSVTSAAAALTTIDVPTITTDPTSQEICLGASVTFTGAAMGDGTISYQWQLNGSDIGGATSASYMIAAVSAADVGAYTLVATNACGSVTSAAAALTTIDVPTITTDPMSQEICVGASVTFTGAAMGDGSISYQWQLNGSDIGGATSASYMIAAVSAADVGAYTLVATNACGSVTSAAAALTTIDVPTITTDPMSQEICIGASVTFAGAAMGDGTITYQWQLNGSDIGGATSASYMIAAVSAADVGAYTLVATNACGSVTSAAAALTTIDVPTITTDPTSQEICLGASVTFTGAAMGDGSISYQWQLNGSDIGGATSASYMIAAVSAADVGAYTLVATNACGSVTSAAAALTTIDVPTITTDPMSQEICVGASVTFTGAAMGDGSISYQWQLNGSDIGGATSASYMIAAVSAADVGAYTLVATNACGSVTSASAALTTIDVPTITTDPLSQDICLGAPVTFTGAATGDGTITYQWQLNGSDIGGATNASYMIGAVTGTDAGAYTLVATNSCGSVSSAAATLSILNAPVITTDPTSQDICLGDPVTFTGAAMGDGPITYQWQFNGSDISGATGASYAIANVGAADAGDYSLVATNICGSSTSVAATLTVLTPPVITQDPASLAVCPGDSAMFTVMATGGSLSYQWFKDGNPIMGATSDSFMILAVASGDAGDYTVEVSNICVPNATSAAATLTLISTLGDDPCTATDQMLMPGVITVMGDTTCMAPQSLVLPAMCPDINNHASNDQWFSFTVQCEGDLTISTDPSTTSGASSFDSHLSVYTGPPSEFLVCPWGLAAPGFVELACNDDAPGALAGESTVTLPVSAGNVYYLRVAGHDAMSMGQFIAELNFQPDLDMIIDQPTGPMSYRVRTTGGNPGDLFFWVVDVNPINGTMLGQGNWFGLFITVKAVVSLYNIGAPFFGVLDGQGESSWTTFATAMQPVPLTVYGVAITVDPNTLQLTGVSCIEVSPPLL